MACINCNETVDLGAAAPCPPVTPCPPRLCAPISYRELGWDYSELDGCTVRTRAAGVLPDGVYSNATVTLVNGNITAVAAGTNVLQSRPEPCSSATGSVAPVPTALTLDPSVSNLLSGGISNLLATGNFNQAGQNITVSGNGKAANPWVLSYTGGTGVMSLASTTLTVGNVGGSYTINTSGVNVNTCGYTIASGIITSWANPIKTINAGAGISVVADTANCAVTVSSKNQSRSITGVSCGSAFIDPESAALPAGASWVIAHIVVSGTKLHIHSSIPANFFDDAGVLLSTGPTSIAYATEALALSAMGQYYSLAGTGVC